MCSDNTCTSCTDKCITNYVDEVEKDFRPTVSFTDKRDITPEMVTRVFQHAHRKLNNGQVRYMYALFDYLKPLVVNMLRSKSDTTTRVTTPVDMRMAINTYYA